MAANNKAVIRLIAFLGLLALLCLSLAPPVMGGNPEEVEKDQKTSSKKRKGAVPVVEKDDGASDDEAKHTPTTTPKTLPTETPAICPESEALNNGFGAGSIFVAILFGMGLMFALGQLYTFWEKRRLNDSPNYRGY